MYDKAGSVLRIETTIAKTTGFKVFRPLDASRSRSRQLAWRPLRKGIADLHRRAQVSQRSNEAYLEALAAMDEPHAAPSPPRPGLPACHLPRAACPRPSRR